MLRMRRKELADLYHFVPSTRHDHWVHDVWTEANAGDPGRGIHVSWLPHEMRRKNCTRHSVCPSSFISYLHSPRVFQTLIVRSREPDTICLLSALKLTDNTSEEW